MYEQNGAGIVNIPTSTSLKSIHKPLAGVYPITSHTDTQQTVDCENTFLGHYVIREDVE